MRRHLTRSPLVAALFSLGAIAGATTQDDKVVPVHQEPRHHVVFESPATRILDIQIPPGDTTLFHTHSDPILYINMASSQTRSQTFGREWPGGETTAPRPPAAAPAAPPRPGRMNSVTSYAQQPLTHRVNNVGQSVFRLIGVTNSSAGDESPAPSPDFGAKPEVENRWFRGYRWSLSTDPTTEHRHGNAVAIVLVSGRATTSSPGSSALDKPGAFAFIEPNTPHRIQAVDGAAEVVEVEVRKPR